MTSWPDWRRLADEALAELREIFPDDTVRAEVEQALRAASSDGDDAALSRILSSRPALRYWLLLRVTAASPERDAVVQEPAHAGLDEESTPFDYLFDCLGDTYPAGNLPVEPASEVVDALKALGSAMVDQPPDAEPDSAIPPVYTYWGQFVDHDVTANTDRDTGDSRRSYGGRPGRRPARPPVAAEPPEATPPRPQPGLLDGGLPSEETEAPPDRGSTPPRWINAELEDREPTEPLRLGQTVTLAFDIDVRARQTALGVTRLADVALFPPGVDEVDLTVQLDTDDFDVAEHVRPLRLPRTGRSRGKARFDITPRARGSASSPRSSTTTSTSCRSSTWRCPSARRRPARPR